MTRPVTPPLRTYQRAAGRGNQVADCTLCGRTGIGLVTNMGEVRRTSPLWRLARHRNPAGGWCLVTTVEAAAIYLPGSR